MNTICDYLSHDHHHCEEIFHRMQGSLDRQDWTDLDMDFREFDDVLKQHMRMEEKVLFPAFLRFLRHADGPITMLRLEHQHIQTVLERMLGALKRFNAIDFLLHTETLTLLMKQHYAKEEEMLYPLLDRVLSDKRASILDAMNECMAPRSFTFR